VTGSEIGEHEYLRLRVTAARSGTPVSHTSASLVVLLPGQMVADFLDDVERERGES
jgi:hypothetical protein